MTSRLAAFETCRDESENNCHHEGKTDPYLGENRIAVEHLSEAHVDAAAVIAHHLLQVAKLEVLALGLAGQLNGLHRYHLQEHRLVVITCSR